MFWVVPDPYTHDCSFFRMALEKPSTLGYKVSSSSDEAWGGGSPRLCIYDFVENTVLSGNKYAGINQFQCIYVQQSSSWNGIQSCNWDRVLLTKYTVCLRQ